MRLTPLAAACLLALAQLTAAPASQADTPPATIQPGDNGLPKHWLQGTPVTAMDADTLYIFEFWATWCGPCIAQMPHLEKLHQATKTDPKVLIVGVNVFDPTPLDKLKSFIKRKKITYPVAADGSRHGNVAKHWLKPLGISGIPHAIALRNNRLVWQGHPAKLTPALISQMKQPGFTAADMAQAARKKTATDKENQEKYYRQLNALYKLPASDVASHADKLVAGQHRGAQDILDFRTAAFNVLFHHGKHTEAQQELKKLATETPDTPNNLIRVATIIITTDELENKQLDFAIKCLERTIKLNPATACIAYQRITDAKLMQGDRQGAIKAAELAVKFSRPQRKLDKHLHSLKTTTPHKPAE